MTSPFLAPAAFLLLIGLGAGLAQAQPRGFTVERPAAQHQPAALAADRKAEAEAARLCATIKERAGEIACLQAHAANRHAAKEAAAKRAQTVPAPDINQAAPPLPMPMPMPMPRPGS